MATKSDDPEEPGQQLTAERAGRLYRLVKLLAGGNCSRHHLTKRLRVGTRTCYRDIDVLRECGVRVDTVAGGYALGESMDAALFKVPFPDPNLSFGDMLTLMRGRSASHRRLQRVVASIAE